MKKLFILSLLITIWSCKQKEEKKIIEKDLTIAKKIANAHGFQNWHNVKTFEFTFGGKMEDSSSGRKWKWNPKTNDVRLIRNTDTTYYNRNNMDSITVKSDKAFINDKFWALIPFQLVWDEGTTISEPEKTKSPAKNQDLTKITVIYSNEGGYTPGDAYDIFYDENYIIQEWNFRKSNATEPSLSNTFENYSDFNGLKIAKEHKKSEGDWNLLIRNVKVEIEE